jgi:hypothetical protein
VDHSGFEATHFSEVVQTPPTKGQGTSVQTTKLVPSRGVEVG